MKRRQGLQALLAACFAASGAGAWARWRLPTGERQVQLPFELIDNRLFVQAQVDDGEPLQLVFDTGGSLILDHGVAERLGLPLNDPFSMPGAGDARLAAWRTRAARLRLGGLLLTDPDFTVLPLASLRRRIGFRRLDGLVGHELLRRFVVRLDFEARRIVLAEPGQAPWPAGARPVPVRWAGNIPELQGQIDGRPARLAIDCGDRSSLTLFRPYVERQRWHELPGERFDALTGWGVGGALPAEVRRVQRLALGEALALDGVTTRLPSGRGGVFASDLADASIGTGCLRRLDLGFDMAQGRLWLAPGPARTDPVDHSGWWLSHDETAGAFVIDHVSPGSRAAAAGLKAGQRVRAIDGVRAHELDLPALRQRWTEAGPGFVMTLQLSEADGRPLPERRLEVGNRFDETRRGA